jgi:hypothetical protein
MGQHGDMKEAQLAELVIDPELPFIGCFQKMLRTDLLERVKRIA